MVFEVEETLNVNLQFRSLESLIQTITTDLISLNQQHEFMAYLDGDTGRIEHLKSDLLAFAHRKGIYDQVRFIGKDGAEKIRVNYSQKGTYWVPEQDLQNKKNRYYFTDTIGLERGQFFISQFDLNIEQGQVEKPNKPMIRFGTPAFDDQGRKRGVLIFNYLGKALIDEFKSISSAGSNRAMLVNAQGYWLIGPEPELEWGFMFETTTDNT